MFESLTIETNIFWSSDRVKIWVKDGKLHYKVDVMMTKQEEIPDTVSDMPVEEFEAVIKSLGIDKWKKNYEPSGFILDGETWSVKYVCDGKKYKSSGENAWPTEWKKLLKFVKSVTGEIGGMY